MVNKERLALGLEALRSGEYIQGRGALKMKDSAGRIKHCCLGVFTEVAIANGCEGVRISPENPYVFEEHKLIENEGYDELEYYDWEQDEDNTLMQAVSEWYGFEPGQGNSQWESYVSDPVLVTESGSKRSATAINDDVDDLSDFHVIADAFERTFLQ